MRIRHATPADAARLSQLACDTYREHFAAIWHPSRLAAYLRSEFAPQTLERALAATDQAWFLLGEAGGDLLLGYAKLNFQRVEPLSGRTGAHLQKIYFRASATGRGLGARMLAHVADTARAHDQRWLWLQVLGSNERARRFYLQHGFMPVGTSTFNSDVGPIAMHTLGRELE
jgi:ribosomal protein S18 acetylase RimI-like enzyme